MKLIIDGVKIKIIPPDLDGDGIIGETELISQRMDNQIQDIIQPTELGESLKELNDDNLDPKSRMSGIDLRSRLHYLEISSILAVDSLVGFKFLPTSCLSFTRQKKRLAVSQDGKGRQDIVTIVGGKQDRDVQTGTGGLGAGIKSFFGGNKQ